MSQTNVADSRSQYSLLVGYIYLFNLIMGTGVLALPAAFQEAGWLISTVILAFLCFTSFLSYTFIVEALSISNAIKALTFTDEDSYSTLPVDTNNRNTDEENRELLDNDAMVMRSNERSVFQIAETFQLADMFKMFCGPLANILFYVNIVGYLFGDLAIYATGFSVSLRDVVCDTNFSNTANITSDDPCRTQWALTRMEMYRILVVSFAVCIAPFMFCHITRSKWLQLITGSLRWLAFLLLIVMAVERAVILRLKPSGQGWAGISQWNPAVLPLVKGEEQPEPIPTPALIRPDGIINLFGVCVYAFMCHHSVTPLITPIRNKRKLLFRLSVPLFLSVLLLNLTISGTAVLAFNHVASLYTLNFIPDDQYIETSKLPHLLAKVIGYFLSLVPAFVFISVFPIVGTTLTNNLSTLASLLKCLRTPGGQRVLRVGLPFLVLLLPVAIALGGDNVGLLVGYTGAFGGTGIQYVMPAVLVCRARRHWAERCSRLKNGLPGGHANNDLARSSEAANQVLTAEGDGEVDARSSEHLLPEAHLTERSPYASPFQHTVWVVLLICWAVITIILVTVNRIYSLVHG